MSRNTTKREGIYIGELPLDEWQQKYFPEMKVDELMSRLGAAEQRRQYEMFMNTTGLPLWLDGGEDAENKAGCAHEMKSYVGFTEAYNYCTKCGEKA